MTKKIIIIYIVLFGGILIFVFMKFTLLWSGFYENSVSLDKDTNKEIKLLLISVIKSRHSTLFPVNESILYTEEHFSEYITQNDDSARAKSMFISIDSNFMGSVKKINDNEYKAEVQLIWPDDWHYYFTIRVINDQYFISYLEIDP